MMKMSMITLCFIVLIIPIVVTDSSWIVVRNDYSYYRVTGKQLGNNDTITSSDVAWIEPEHVYRVSAIQCGTVSWGLDRIAPPANDGNYSYTEDGAGVNVYVVDTGIRLTHLEFEGRAFFGYDALGENEMGDPHGHGTHVAGLAASHSYGTAKKAHLVSVRVMNEYGLGTTSTLVDGLKWILNNGQLPAVVSISIIGSKSTLINAYIDLLTADNFTVVTAAGNDNTDACNYSPVSAAGAFGVGATDFTDTRAVFSNYGSCVDMFAPGTSIISTVSTSDTAIAFSSGTSMACPFVSGIAALVLGQNPKWLPTQVLAQIESAAKVNAVTNPGTGSANLLLQTPFPDLISSCTNDTTDMDSDTDTDTNDDIFSAATRLTHPIIIITTLLLLFSGM